MDKQPKDIYATVDEVIAILKRVSKQGKGHYLVGCNDEYYLALKDEVPKIHDPSESVELGGYC